MEREQEKDTQAKVISIHGKKLQQLPNPKLELSSAVIDLGNLVAKIETHLDSQFENKIENKNT